MPKPWTTRQEMLVDLALQSAISDPETIRQTRPVVPQQLFPQNRGMYKQEPNLMSVFSLSRYGVSYRSWISGTPVMPEMMTGDFEGTSRYSMNSLGNV